LSFASDFSDGKTERDCAESQSQRVGTEWCARTFHGRLPFRSCCGWSATQPRSAPHASRVLRPAP